MAERGRAGNHPGELPGVPPGELSAACEALLFASARPVSAQELARALGVHERQVQAALQQLEQTLAEGRRGIQLARVAGGYQLVTRARFFPYLRRLWGGAPRRPALSAAALETLAVVAYCQPVTRAEIEAIRGVSCDSSLATLLERGLVEVAGHAPGPGRPALYRTTRRFLEEFGLESLDQLPALDGELAPLQGMVRPSSVHTKEDSKPGAAAKRPAPGPDRGALAQGGSDGRAAPAG